MDIPNEHRKVVLAALEFTRENKPTGSPPSIKDIDATMEALKAPEPLAVVTQLLYVADVRLFFKAPSRNDAVSLMNELMAYAGDSGYTTGDLTKPDDPHVAMLNDVEGTQLEEDFDVAAQYEASVAEHWQSQDKPMRKIETPSGVTVFTNADVPKS